MRGISKSFGGVRANSDVDFIVRRGEIVGLLGENGAGKTTLMNILFGAYRADAGRILVEGREAEIGSSADALAAGIGMVHQHFHLAPRLSVLENLLVGMPGRGGWIDRAGGLDRLAQIEREFGLTLDANRPVSSLAIGEQQRLEIAKALFRGARTLILDEPTAVLTPSEVHGLFAALRAMAAKGLGIIFISHKLNEVRALTHRCVVLRHGRVAGHVEAPAHTTSAEMARLMCGHEIVPPVRPDASRGDVVLNLEGVETSGHTGMPLRGVDLEVRAGEIVGVAGVSGNGQRALADLVSGIVPPTSGLFEVRGVRVTHADPNAMMALDVARIPEDRMSAGLATALSLSDNLVLSRIGDGAFSRFRARATQVHRGLCRASDRGVRHSLPRPRRARGGALGRQPAEDAARARARVRSEGADRRPADAGSRRRRRAVRP